jgi:WD40 repeat protein
LFEFQNTAVREVATLRGFLLGVNSVAFSPDGKRLATASSGKEAIKLWDAASHQELLTLEGNGLIWETKFSPDGRILGAATYHGGSVHLWRAPSFEEIESEAKAKTQREKP